MTKVITLNRARCKLCKQVITSYHRHDYKTCLCGNLSVDGGVAYLKRSAVDLESCEEMSEWTEVNDEVE